MNRNRAATRRYPLPALSEDWTPEQIAQVFLPSHGSKIVQEKPEIANALTGGLAATFRSALAAALAGYY